MKAWPAACALLAGGAGVVGVFTGFWPETAGHPFAWNADTWVLRPWTLWTAAWVHPSGGTLIANMLALAALAVAGSALKAGRAAALALVLAWPASTLGLSLWPAVHAYSSLGGVIHAAAMVLWAHLALNGLWKPLSFVIFAGMGFKLLSEGAWLTPVGFDPGWGFNVVQAAHLTGAVAGALAGMVCVAIAIGRTRARQAPATD